MAEKLCPFGTGQHKKLPWSNVMPSGQLVQGETHVRSGLVCVNCHKTWEWVDDKLIPTIG